MASQGILLLFFSFLCCHGLKSIEVPGGQFGTGAIRIGEIELREITAFLPTGGATLFSPSSLPSGFFHLGSPNPSSPRTLIARDTSHSSSPSLSPPINFTLLFSTNSSRIWLLLPPPGFSPVGYLITSSTQNPLLSSIRCVRDDLLIRPCKPGTPLACFNTNALTLASTPNLTQINALIQTHAPWFYFHPNEPYLPSSVPWFFNNGALLYTNSTPISHVPIDPAGDILPQGGRNDGGYWIDLPVDSSAQQIIKAGNLSSARAYIHVKPATGIASTDIVFWLFYPFNGAAKARVGLFSVGLGRLGEHVGDWEHVTQRFSNFDGGLKEMYFSQHSSGSWVDAADLEYVAGGIRPAAYATLHGHAFYPKAGLVLKGEVERGIGLMDLTAKGGLAMDAAEVADVVSAAGYLGVEEPPWLQYMREWGPKVEYDEAKEMEKAVRFLPGKLKTAVRNLVKKLPPELLGEEGPTGPKEKASWNGDEA